MKRALAIVRATDTSRLILVVALALTLNSLLNVISLDVIIPLLGAIVGTNFLQDQITLRGEGLETISITYIRVLTYAFNLAVLGMLLSVVARREHEEEPDEVECPYCLSAIPAEASRCAFCASDIEALMSGESSALLH